MPFLLSLFFYFSFLQDHANYSCKDGHISFTSNTSLELIRGHSKSLRGVFDANTNEFSFAVPMNSFQGFNSELQSEHFEENYVESTKYPEAFFSGHLVENINFSKIGDYKVRAKGRFKLHGVEKDFILQAILHIASNAEIRIDSEFKLNLPDFNIKIPRLVHKKLAEEIQIKVNCILKKS
ncbi:MAG: YceI family protein [Chitinophagaceae bacterium]|nr:YceI family protein [Chitinophagaceae bacterium]